MNSTIQTARFVGALFLIAIVSSLAGAGVLETVIQVPDFFNNLKSQENLLKVGVLLESINGIAVAGIGILMFPVLKHHSEQMAAGYLSFRIMETLFCIAAAILPLSLLTLARQNGDTSNLLQLANLILSARATVAGILIPLFFSLGALIFYTFLYQTKFLPRFISIWGFTGVAFIITLNIFSFETSAGMILALPIILNEIFLGIWLIVKGFNKNILK